MQFSYRVSDATGRIESGSASADSREQLMHRLKAQGNYILEIKTETVRAGAFNLNAIVSRSLARFQISKQDRLNFTQQLAGLLSAGIALEKSLGIMSRLKLRPELGAVVTDLRRKIQEGLSFCNALEHYPDLFPVLYINLARAGETGGILPQILNRLAVYLEEEITLQRFIIGSLIYPVIVISASLGVLVFYVITVIPRFQSVFQGMGSQLPIITRIVLGFGTALLNFWWLPLGCVTVVAVWFAKLLSSEAGRYRLDQIKLMIPLLGSLLQKTATSKLALSLSLLNDSGVPLLQSLTIVSGIVGNEVMKQALLEVERDVRQGSPLAKSMSHYTVFPGLFVEMLGVGEESGNIGPMLRQVAKTYDGEVKQGLSIFMSTFEPFLILLMVGIIATLAIAVLLPIMNINVGN